MSSPQPLRRSAPAGFNYHLLRTALARFGKTPTELDDAQRAAVAQQAGREYELEQRILGAKEARGVEVPASVVDDALERVVARYESREDFLADMQRNELDMDALREALRRELKVEAILDRVSAQAATISELDVRIYYYMHTDKWQRPERRSARHILITVNPDFPENERAAVEQRLQSVLNRVQRKPHRFAEQAMKHSECPTALQGGLLGELSRGQLYAELDAELFTMHEGEIRGPIASPMGFHLLYCERIQPGGQVPLAEVAERIRELLTERRRRMCQRSWVRNLVSANSGHEDDA